MPYKHNESRRHKMKKSIYKVTNWASYNTALRKRGDITVWFTEEAIAAWTPEPIKKRGAPLQYSDLAIETCLMFRQLFRLPLRQTEGFVCSLVKLMALDLNIPDYSTLSKRSIGLPLQQLIDNCESGTHFLVDSTGLKVYGKDEWNQEKHGTTPKRTWRKLHLAIDENHQIVASDLTGKEVGDLSALPGLLDQVESFEVFMADGAYDSDKVYQQIKEKQATAKIVIPPPKNALPGSSQHPVRNEAVDTIKHQGRMTWQRLTGYGLRALVELAMLRYKTIIGPKMKARELPQQKTEAEISVRLLNRMTSLGMPVSVKAT